MSEALDILRIAGLTTLGVAAIIPVGVLLYVALIGCP